MRRGSEEEEWDRLSFLLSNMAAMHGVKSPKMDSFHKFRMPDTRLTKKKLHSIKELLPNVTVKAGPA